MLFFATEEVQLRQDLIQVILNKDDQGYDLLKRALDAYTPAQITGRDANEQAAIREENRKALEAIQPGLYSDTILNTDLAPPYAKFLSNFSGDHAPQLAKWIENNPSHQASQIVIDGLSKMKGDAAVRELGRLTFDSQHKAIKERGLRGLSALDLDSEIGNETRLSNLKRLIESLTEYDNIEETNKALVNLLRPNDWDVVVGKLPPPPADGGKGGSSMKSRQDASQDRGSGSVRTKNGGKGKTIATHRSKEALLQ